jgi:AcrR family transcriptional regulator
LSISAVSRQEPRRQRTRAALIKAGLELLAERSIDTIAVDEIVEAAKVSKGSFFNHFKDKYAFAGEIAADVRGRVEAEVTLVNQGRTDPAERVARAVSRFVLFALTEKREARVMVQIDRFSVGPGHPMNAGLRADLAAGQAEGRLSAPSLESGVMHVVGVCQMLIVSVLSPSMTTDQAARIATDSLSLALRSLGLSASEAQAVASAAVEDVLRPTLPDLKPECA